MSINSITKDVMDVVNNVPEAEHTAADQYWCEQFVRECLDHKADLISLLSKHPSWDGENYRIHFDADYTRPHNVGAASDELYHMASRIKDLADLEGNEDLYTFAVMLRNNMSWQDVFSSGRPIDAYGIELIQRTLPHVKMTEGKKPTRALINILRQLGFDNYKGNSYYKSAVRDYSYYCDHMNPLSITRHTVLSVNPADFLLMSNGNSWTSCYVTGYEYGSPNTDESGCYSIGTLEYALDYQTMILYTVEKDVEDCDITFAPKYTRELFFWNGNTLVGSRCYPANDDIHASIYKENRAIVEGIVSNCLNLPNVWRKVDWGYEYTGKGYFDPAFRGRYGKEQFPGYELTFMTERPEMDRLVRAGFSPVYCLCCGETITAADAIVCSSCREDRSMHCDHCGERMTEDEVIWIGSYGGYLCERCAEELGYHQCYQTGDWLHEDEMIYIENDDVWVSRRWNDNHSHYYCCEDCGNWYSADAIRYVEGYGDVCDDCYESGDYFYCVDCGCYFCFDELAETDSHLTVCNSCMEKRDDHYLCSECGETWHANDEPIVDGDTGELICESCRRMHESALNMILESKEVA